MAFNQNNTFFDCLFDFLNEIDLFGEKIGFSIKGESEYHTIFGKILSLFIYVLTIVFGIFFSIELFTKTKPSVIISTEMNNNPTKVNYPNNFFFMFALQNNTIYKPYIDEKIYYPLGALHKKGNNPLKTYFKLENCEKVLNDIKEDNKTLYNKYHKELGNLSANNFYCFPVKDLIEVDEKTGKVINNTSEPLQLAINQFWENENFSMLQFKLYECGYKNKEKCKSKEELNEIFKTKTVTLYTIRNYVRSSNYSYPFISNIYESFFEIPSLGQSKVTEFLKFLKVKSHTGWFYHEESEPINTYDSMQYFSDDKGDDGKFFTMTFQLSNTIDVYQRNYYQIKDLLADISGIFDFFVLISTLILFRYNSTSLSVDIINEIYMKKERKIFFNKPNHEKSEIIKDFEVCENSNERINKTINCLGKDDKSDKTGSLNVDENNNNNPMPLSSYSKRDTFKLDDLRPSGKRNESFQQKNEKLLSGLNCCQRFFYKHFHFSLCNLFEQSKKCRNKMGERCINYNNGKNRFRELLDINRFLLYSKKEMEFS